MDTANAGYVFSFYALVMFLTAPVFGKIVSNTKQKLIMDTIQILYSVFIILKFLLLFF